MLSGFVILFLYFSQILASEIRGPRIINGNQAAEGQFPFAVAISMQRGNTQFLCGGSLINTTWVLTAANCVFNFTRFSIYMGSTNLGKVSSNGMIINSTEYVVHPSYALSPSVDNNLGLIRLPQAVTFSSTIQSISLPSKSLASNQNVTAIGWGATSDVPIILPILQNVSLNTISTTQCKQYYPKYNVTNNVVCALGSSKGGICHGDVGGPLIQFDAAGKITQVGIASFYSENSCEQNYPSGFTRTFEHMKWIRNVTQSDASRVLLRGYRFLLISIAFVGVLLHNFHQF